MPIETVMPRALVLLVVLVLSSGCVSLPKQTSVRGLYRDLRLSVEFRENDDWVVDSMELEDAARTVMRSICLAPRERREDLAGWLEQAIAARGGPSHLQYRGSMTRGLRETRRLERVLLLLRAADRRAAECPYWLEQDASFAGIQGNERRVTAWLESSGGGTLLLSNGQRDFGGGGGVRLLGSVGIAPRASLALGFELGGNGTLPKTDSGARQFEAVFASAVPLILRLTDVSRILDLELAFTTSYLGDERIRGGRVGIGFGLMTPRVLSLQPYAVLWIGYGLVPAQHGEDTQHSLWAGTRLGFDWSPGR